MEVRRIENTDRGRQSPWVYVLPACSSLFSQKGALSIHLKELGEALASHSRSPLVSASNVCVLSPVSVSVPVLSESSIPSLYGLYISFFLSYCFISILNTHVIPPHSKQNVPLFLCHTYGITGNGRGLFILSFLGSCKYWHCVFRLTAEL